MAVRPTEAELNNIIDCRSLAAWCGIDAVTPQPAPSTPPANLGTATTPAAVSDMRALFAFLVCAPQEHYRGLSTISPEDWKTMTAGIMVNGSPPGVMLRGKYNLFHSTARRICNLEAWPEPVTAPALTGGPAAAPTQQGSVPLHGQVVMPARVNLPTLNVGRVLDQRMTDEITYLPSGDVVKMLDRYIKIFEMEPPPPKAPTLDQLTALHFSLQNDRTPFADLGVFGKYGHRRARAMSFTGLVPGPGGTLQTTEILGPPNLEAWKESYDVLFSALIMLDTVRRPQLAAYRSKICLLHAQYGPQTWALLYQADVRCRSEFMDRLRYRLLAKHNAALQASLPSTFDTAHPWDSVWAAATVDADFWKQEYEVNALLIKANTVQQREVLGTDATVAPTFTPQQSVPTAEPTRPPRNGAKAKAAPAKGPCKGFNAGTCHGTSCPSGHGKHVCNRCGNSSHGASSCRADGGGKRKNEGWGKKNNNNRGNKQRK